QAVKIRITWMDSYMQRKITEKPDIIRKPYPPALRPDTLSEGDQNRDLRPRESDRPVRFFARLPRDGGTLLLRAGRDPQADRVHGSGAAFRMRRGSAGPVLRAALPADRKSTRLNSSH